MSNETTGRVIAEALLLAAWQAASTTRTCDIHETAEAMAGDDDDDAVRTIREGIVAALRAMADVEANDSGLTTIGDDEVCWRDDNATTEWANADDASSGDDEDAVAALRCAARVRAGAAMPAGYDGPCRIWREPQYYEGTCNAPAEGWLLDDDGRPREYDSVTEAQAARAAYYEPSTAYEGVRDCNVLSHGQYAADKLTVVAMEAD